MISRNKGILSVEFLVPLIAFVFSVVTMETLYRTVVTPRANDAMVERRLRAAQGGAGIKLGDRSIYVVIMHEEPKWEIIFCLWGMLMLGYKLTHIARERRLFSYDFIRLQPGERIIPDDALDRYKELKSAIDREPRWRERLLPECLLAALHRFQATNSVRDAADAVRERTELASDSLDSSLSLVRYIAWAIPAIGFVGTVRGIGHALEFAEQAIHGDLSPVTSNLGLAFNATMVGLTMCIVLMFFLHMVQARQEAFIIEMQTFCRDKLIDVMKVPSKEETSALYS